LEWPTNRFDNLPERVLFFACKGNSDDVCLRENVALLTVGEGAVLLRESVTAATWNKMAEPL